MFLVFYTEKTYSSIIWICSSGLLAFETKSRKIFISIFLSSLFFFFYFTENISRIRDVTVTLYLKIVLLADDFST